MYKVFEFIFEVIGWLKIVASPFVIGLGLEALIYFSSPNPTRLILEICVATLGLIIGIIWATRVWKQYSTILFLSRIMATPELDDKREEKVYNYLSYESQI